MDFLDGKIAQNENVITQMKDLQNKMKVSHHVILTVVYIFVIFVLLFKLSACIILLSTIEQ